MARKKRNPREREIQKLLQEQHAAFRKKFGRNPGPHDPVFFDPTAETPKPMDAERMAQDMVEAFHAAGVPGHLIYAFEKTGRIVDDIGWDLLTEEEQREWLSAVEEYWLIHPEDRPRDEPPPVRPRPSSRAPRGRQRR